jgi:uncharacterized protein YegP (UPF0339 family)
MPAKYQVYLDVAGEYRFRLRAENNKIVAVSEGYEQHAGCMNGIQSVQANCNVAIEDTTIEGKRIPDPKFQVFSDKIGEYRFRLIASNGEIIAASEGYLTKEGCLNGIEAVKKSCDAEIEDLTAAQKTLIEPMALAALAPTAEVIPTPTPEVMPPAPTMAAPMPTTEVAPTPPAPVETMYTGMVETKLELMNVPEKAAKGDMIVFQGKLARSDTDKGIPYAVIDIFEHDRSFLNDTWLADGGTREDGSFSIDWKARQVDWWESTTEIYAMFYKNIHAKPSKSQIYKIKIK